MADVARLPHLAVPFAITGAAAGWLSSGLVVHSAAQRMALDFRVLTTIVCGVVALATGILMRGWILGADHWRLDPPDPAHRPESDNWPRHITAILCAGALAGAAVPWPYFVSEPGLVNVICAFVGFFCAIPFVPVLALVLASARRAQRARLGSLVAGADRRAVWGVLATALVVATLEALPDDALRDVPWLEGGGVAHGLLAACAALIVAVLVADVVAYRRARGALGPGLSLRESASLEADGAPVSRVDLGLGDDVRARVRQDGAPYRSQERVLGLVTGDVGQALTALRRAIGRGALGLTLVALVGAAHVVAGSDGVVRRYEEARCSRGVTSACLEMASRSSSAGRAPPEGAIAYFEQGCDGGSGWSCLSLAQLYRGTKGDGKGDVGTAVLFEYRAAQHGICPDGTTLVQGSESVCVAPGDPRYPY